MSYQAYLQNCGNPEDHQGHNWGDVDPDFSPWYCPGVQTKDIQIRQDLEVQAAKLQEAILSTQPQSPHLPPIQFADSLLEIMTRQEKFQRMLGHNFDTMSDEERIEYIRNQVLSLLDETHEALAEVGWKPWATSRHINRESFVSELIDIFHFLLNLFLVVGAKPHEVFAGYLAKNEKNIARQETGYDGVSTKCPGCKRAYDDAGVECQPAIAGPPSSVAYCAQKGSSV